MQPLGCDNLELLFAGRYTLESDIDVNQNLEKDDNKDENAGTIATIYGESVFHKAGQTEDVYVELGDHTGRK